MCGIYGIGLLKDNTMEQDLVVTLMKSLASKSEARGSDATGMAFSTAETINVIKNNDRASLYVNGDSFNTNIKLFDINEIHSIIGHCRAMTKGSHFDNNNNHPIVTENIVGVHNGVIYNDEELYKEDFDLDRRGIVDSEVIFQLISNADEYTATSDAIRETTKKLQGSFACAFVDKRSPHMLWLFRNNNPIYVVVYEKKGLIVFASALSYIQDSIKHVCTEHSLQDSVFDSSYKVEIKHSSGIGIDLLYNEYFHFEIEEKYSRSYGGFLT